MVQNQLDEFPEAEEIRKHQFEEVNLEEFDEKLDEEFDDTGGKPTFTKNTNAVVASALLKRAVNPKTDRKGEEYYDMLLTIKTVYSDGQESYDNYSGLREYNRAYWNGDKSAFGRLKQLMVDEFGVKTRRDMIRKLLGAKVKVKTETTTYQGQEFRKNVIQGFR
ncbi:MAG: hypothetical protein DDT40_00837 [candidate division WS2 bacterium]|nr:hypothetical protein [Candidatus Psychracetigena formicireducens]